MMAKQEKKTPIISGEGRFSDPNVIGPGMWIWMHTEAFHAKSPEHKENFIRNLRINIKNFRCKDCRDHAMQYIDRNPPELYAKIGVDEGREDTTMFRYTWLFHNTVNKRLGKPIVEWDVAYAMYSNPESMFCDKNCGKGDILINTSPDIRSIKSNPLIKIISPSK